MRPACLLGIAAYAHQRYSLPPIASCQKIRKSFVNCALSSFHPASQLPYLFRWDTHGFVNHTQLQQTRVAVMFLGWMRMVLQPAEENGGLMFDGPAHRGLQRILTLAELKRDRLSVQRLMREMNSSCGRSVDVGQALLAEFQETRRYMQQRTRWKKNNPRWVSGRCLPAG